MSAVLKDIATGFRHMAEADIDQVLEIEQQIYQYPWTRGIFKDCLGMEYSCWVYTQDFQIVAYGIVSIAAEESHLLNLSVHPEVQRTGLGRKMLDTLISVAQRNRVDTVLLEVRPSNHAALALYFGEGFNEVGVRRNYYPSTDGREDALVLARALQNP